MEKEYKTMGTIRGTRYSIELTKRVRGIPGFAPEWKDKVVGEVVFNFPHGDGKTYVQFQDTCPVLYMEDIEEILSLAKEGFKEDRFPKLRGNEETN